MRQSDCKIVAGKPHVGLLALQGNFERHREALQQLGAHTILVKKSSELDAIDALVIPGGESTALLKLSNEDFRNRIREIIVRGLPTLVTCAGLIFLAKNVTNPAQVSLGVLDIDVERNAYGRHLDSFIEPQLGWTPYGMAMLQSFKETLSPKSSRSQVEGIFIRAPKIIRTGPNVDILIEHHGDPVLIKEKNILGTTFHPELSQGKSLIHELLLTKVG